MSAPDISVVITAHNEAARIGACLASLSRQTGLPPGAFEIVLIDDRSADGTAEVARRTNLADLRILAADASDQRALTTRQKALDLGIREARGAIIVTLDADARLAPTGLVDLTAAILANREDVTAGFAAFVSERGLIGAWQTVDVAFYLGVCRLLAALRLDAGVLFGNCAFRRDLYRDLGGFETIGFALTEDLSFARAALAQGARIGYCPAVAVDVAAAATWSGLIDRARRVGSGKIGPLSLAIGLWMALYPILLLAALIMPTSLTPDLLAARWAVGAGFVGGHLIAARRARLLAFALVYEPVAIAIGLLVLLRSGRDRHVTWGGRDYGR